MTKTAEPGPWVGLRRGFTERYLSYDEVCAQLDAWCEAAPSLCRQSSIGTTAEGRELRLLTIGRDPARLRPALWVDGNMHASELAGTNVALAMAEERLARCEEGDDSLTYVLPRMCPDGAEAVLTTGRYVRSNPGNDRPHQSHPHWRCCDVDGDGVAASMRVIDEGGEWVASDEIPGLMVHREIGDPGPFYKLYPEGVIENFDGTNVPSPHFLSDNRTDLNRNFPWAWAPEDDQMGAGAFPLSEVESRAVVEFTAARPHIFAWINLHTFGGVFIRPLGHKPDNQMEPFDLAVFRQVEAWAEEFTGYPTVSGFEEFTYEPNKPLHGDLTDYAYHQRGCLSYVIELWDLFAEMKWPRPKRFVDNYTRIDRQRLEDLGRWDRDHNQGRVVGEWRPMEHPQLGKVEVGGWDPRIGISNPPPNRLKQLCAEQARVTARVADLAPRLHLELSLQPTAAGHDAVAIVENRGYLPTCVLESARNKSFSEPVYLVVDSGPLADPSKARIELGHLDGWGRGRFGQAAALFMQRSRGTQHRATTRFPVSGNGVLEVRAGSARVGWITGSIRVEV